MSMVVLNGHDFSGARSLTPSGDIRPVQTTSPPAHTAVSLVWAGKVGPLETTELRREEENNTRRSRWRRHAFTPLHLRSREASVVA